MRVLMLDNELPPLGGGMGTTNLALLKNFANLPTLEIDVVTSALGGRGCVERFSERIQIVKVPVWNRNIHHSSNRELILYTMEALPVSWKLMQNNDYDFCFAWSTVPAGAVAYALKRFKGLSYIVWVSGPDIPGFEKRYEIQYKLLMPLLKRIWKHASPVIAKCAGEVDMIHRCSPGLPIKVIPNGVDLNVFKPGNHDHREEPFRVICVARLIERKGQHHLIRAVKRLADQGYSVRMDLIGTGDSLQDFKNLARDLGIEDNIHFVGYIPREQISAHYSAADVFVLPSFNEGMALAVLEAIGSGLPVIVTETGGTADLVVDGENGFIVQWGDVEGLAEKLRKLFESRELRLAMGASSRRIAERFSWDRIGREYIDLFEGMTIKASSHTS